MALLVRAWPGCQVANPVPLIRHPDWLLKRVAAKDDKTRQARIMDSFSALPKPGASSFDGEPSMAADPPVRDLEDTARAPRPVGPTGPRAVVHRKRPAEDAADEVRARGYAR